MVILQLYNLVPSSQIKFYYGKYITHFKCCDKIAYLHKDKKYVSES